MLLSGKSKLIFCLPVFLILAGCPAKLPVEEKNSFIPVRTQILSFSEICLPVRSSGKLSTKTESKLSFKTGGIIEKIYVDDGKSVVENQLLASLDLSEIKSKARQAELGLEKARRDHDRVMNLYRDSVVTLEHVQNAGTALDFAGSEKRIADFNLRYSNIHAPSKGKILKKLMEENEITAPGLPVFLFASTEDDWIVRTSLSDRDLIRVNLLDSAEISFDAYPGEKFPGRVSETGSVADPYTGTYEVEIALSREPERMISGLVASIQIFPPANLQGIRIPYSSLFESEGMTAAVFVIEQGCAFRRNIRIRSITDEGVIIAEGLYPGEELVSHGVQMLSDGAKVEIRP